MTELGIVDTRNLINLINEKYALDFTDYALTSFKRRLEKIIDQNNLKHPEILYNRLTDNADFFDEFIDSLTVPSTEMFRDPSLWRVMRDELIRNIYRESGANFKIWLPNSVSGDELFSLAILLSEMGLLDKVNILVSSLSNKSIQTIRSGEFSSEKMEISTDNYTRSNGKGTLSDYIIYSNGKIIRDVSLIRNVTFFRQDTSLQPIPQGVKLILFRNKMIYFNQSLQTRVIKNLYQTGANGCYLIIGIKEAINGTFGGNEFTVINNVESIYKRRN